MTRRCRKVLGGNGCRLREILRRVSTKSAHLSTLEAKCTFDHTCCLLRQVFMTFFVLEINGELIREWKYGLGLLEFRMRIALYCSCSSSENCENYREKHVEIEVLRGLTSAQFEVVLCLNIYAQSKSPFCTSPRNCPTGKVSRTPDGIYIVKLVFHLGTITLHYTPYYVQVLRPISCAFQWKAPIFLGEMTSINERRIWQGTGSPSYPQTKHHRIRSCSDVSPLS